MSVFEKVILAIPLLISLILWAHFLFSLRRLLRPMWSGKYIPLKAVITVYDSSKNLGEYVFSYEGKEITDSFIPPGHNIGLDKGSECYIYYNPKNNQSFLGIFHEVGTANIVFMVVRNCLPLLVYLFYAIIVLDLAPVLEAWPGTPYMFLSLALLLPVWLVVYNFPRWRQCKRFVRSSWSMAIDAQVVERRRISRKKDLLLYRSTDPEYPFVGEVKVRRHPMRYEEGDTMLVYYNTQRGKSFPHFKERKIYFAHWRVFAGFFLIGIILVPFIFTKLGISL